MLAAWSLPLPSGVLRRQMAESAPLFGETEELRPLVRGVVAHILGQGRQHPDVEDCTHEALRRAIEGKHRLKDGEPLRPWVLGIARHVALDTLRARKKNRRLVTASTTTDPEEGEPLDRVPDSAPGADQQLERAQRIHRIRVAMQALPEDQRRALELFHLEGLGYREIAAKMGVPIGTVGTWVTRGRRTVAEALDGAEA